MKSFKVLAMTLILQVLILGLTASSAVAGSPENGKPLRGFGEMHAVPSAGLIDCLAPDGSVVASLPRQFDALARYSLLGRTEGGITIESCDFNPANGTLVGTGPVVQVAANGDEVYTEFLAVFAPDFSFDLEIWIVGGNGRFTDACGSAIGGGQLNPMSGLGLTWLSGWIANPNDHGNDSS